MKLFTTDKINLINDFDLDNKLYFLLLPYQILILISSHWLLAGIKFTITSSVG
jgi:hypothetical protein